MGMIQKLNTFPDQQLRSYLAYCMYPSQDRIQSECHQYKSQRNRELYGLYVDGELAGIAGIVYGASMVELKHIAIHPDYRRRGYGRQLIKAVMNAAQIGALFAETDAQSLAFYEKLGFAITSLGEKFPGTERFRCVLQAGLKVDA